MELLIGSARLPTQRQQIFKQILLEFLLDALVKTDAFASEKNFNFSVLKAKNIQDLLENGFTYVDNFLPKGLINRVLHEIETNTRIVWKHPYNHGRDDIIAWLKPFDDICTADPNKNNALNELIRIDSMNECYDQT